MSQSHRIQLALNSGHKLPVSKAEKHSKAGTPANNRKKRSFLQFWHRAVGKTGNRRTVPEFGKAEFWSFCTRLLIKQEFPDAKAPLSLIFDYFSKVDFCRFFKSVVSPALPKQQKQYKQETGVQSQNSAKPNSGVLCLCREKRSFFDKPRLQRRPKQVTAQSGRGGSRRR